MHSHAKVPAVPFGDTGDEVRAPGERYRRRKAVDYGDDLALQAERMQGFIDCPPVEALPRHVDMPAHRVSCRRDLALRKGMSHAHDTHIAIAKQRLHPQFRRCRLLDDARFQVHCPLAKWPAVLVGLLHEA